MSEEIVYDSVVADEAPLTAPAPGFPARMGAAIGGALAGLAATGGTGWAFGTGVLVGAKVALRAGLWRAPRPMPHQTAALLDHPWRLRYRHPATLAPHLGLFAGMTVGDLGCGSGLFTVLAASMVGERGKVHALDCQEPLLKRARARIDAAGVAQRVVFHRAGIHQMPLADGALDVALMIAVMGEVPAQEAALEEVRRVLKPGGRLIVSEELPDPAYVPGFRVRRWAEAVGFRWAGTAGTPFCYVMTLLNDR